MMKRGARGLFTLLGVGFVALLAGCSMPERYTYVLYDSTGCAFFVVRSVPADDKGSDPHNALIKVPFDRDWWKGDDQYSANIQRLSHDDLPTCHLKKDHAS